MLEYDIRYGDRPAVYDLKVGGQSQSLVIAVHQEVLDYTTATLSKPGIPMIDSLREELSLPAFIRPIEGECWGFGPIIGSLPTMRDDHALLRCPLPVVSKAGDFKKANWEAAYATSATLNVLFTLLSLDEVEISDQEFHQLISVNLLTRKGTHGGSLSVTLAKALLPWIKSQPIDINHRNIARVMKAAHEQLIGLQPLFDLRDFAVVTRESNQVHLSVPGDACGLDPTDFLFEEDKGYRLSPHNVDNPVQQLTLLMGIAAICEAARKAGY